MLERMVNALDWQQWSLMRVLRILIGSAVCYQAFAESNVWMALLGGLFLLQGIFNTGCAGNNCKI